MEEFEKIIRERLNNKPLKFNINLNKKEYFRLIEKYKNFTKYFPKSILESLEDSDAEQEETKVIPTFKKTPRIMKIEELQNKLKKLKGKSLNTVDSLKRKGLKNRIKKKLKLEERAKLKRSANKEHVKIDKSKLNKPIIKEENQYSDSNQNDIVYSKFDITSNNVDNDEYSEKKKGPRDPMRILQKVEKSNKKLREMEARGRHDKVNEIKDRLAWKMAIQKAEGEKVKDDIELLKKSIRKKKNAKNRSQKKWEEREKSKQQKMEEAQKKRRTNIQKKKKEKQKQKVKKLVKKGRIVQ